MITKNIKNFNQYYLDNKSAIKNLINVKKYE